MNQTAKGETVEINFDKDQIKKVVEFGVNSLITKAPVKVTDFKETNRGSRTVYKVQCEDVDPMLESALSDFSFPDWPYAKTKAEILEDQNKPSKPPAPPAPPSKKHKNY